MGIHPTAIIDPKAEISSDAEIGPYCIIGSGVNIGARTRLIAHVYLEGKLTIGEENIFYPYCSCGVTPQDKKYKGEASETRIGNGNSIREFVTINRGTQGGGMLTSIGDRNLLMAYVHVAHDVTIHNHTILANGVTFAGHVVVEDYANIGGLSAIHQFCRIGRHSMIGSYSVIKQNVLPYSITASNHQVEVYGANRIGLERSGYSSDAIEALQTAFRILTRAGLNTTQALTRIEEEVPQTSEVRDLLEFIRASERGFLK
ncbi:MAG: acyl-ACP--UDP-N-acetylglucosamine O-acyltransferase [Acidobacteriaceae bacterium]|nr:acyl-ACP--UDP-N-acetylglucosamine O-acyltransferase [Acidobacteriaceae bacterium]MBV9767038.1 acyl-ACP--UDP-N-acetylglucosamine O-acyltransferase [Acidobacteriaceae bacterium]